MPVSSRMFRDIPIVPASRRKVPSTRNAGQLCPGTSDPDAPRTLILNLPVLPSRLFLCARLDCCARPSLISGRQVCKNRCATFESERNPGDPIPLPQPVRGRDHVERRGPADRHRDPVAFLEVPEGDIGIPVDNVVPLHPFSVLHGESAARGIEPNDRPGDYSLLRLRRDRRPRQEKGPQRQDNEQPLHPPASLPSLPGRSMGYHSRPPSFPVLSVSPYSAKNRPLLS